MLIFVEILSLSDSFDSHYYICPLAKQKHLSFSSNNHVASHVFDLIHCDVWGPFKASTYNGFRYFLTLAMMIAQGLLGFT